MPGTLYNPNNVVIGLAVLWLQPYDPLNLPLMPDDSIPLWGDFGDPWQGAGATDNGFKFSVASQTNNVTVEEQSTPVAQTLSSRGVTISASLAEDTVQVMQWSYGTGVITSVAASPGPPVVSAKQVLTFDDNILEWAAILETQSTSGKARRYFVPKMNSGGTVDTSFRRASDKRMYPLTLTSVCAPSEIAIYDFT